jgi:hypothetical protein
MALAGKEIKLIIGCDCEPVGDPIGPAAFSRRGRRENWDLAVRSLRTLTERLKTAVPSEFAPKLTILLRSDTYMNDVFGDYAYCARASYEFFDGLRSEGHEIGWHPHLWRWLNDRWTAEVNDVSFMKDCFGRGFNCLSDYFQAKSVRTGWNFMSNEIMYTLESLGLQADFSAQPGIKFQEITQGYGCDWIGAPTDFYFPSRGDYRTRSATDAVHLLEMPITLTETPDLVRWIRPIADRFRKIQRVPSRYEPLNIAKNLMFNKAAFFEAVSKCNARGMSCILTSFHPSDLTHARLFSMDFFIINMKFLVSLCRKEGVRLIGMTATQAAEEFLVTNSQE